MSDTMLHGVLQMPHYLWKNDAIDIVQRHGRYLEASKRIAQLERERDEARTELDEARNIAKMAYTRLIGLGVSDHTRIQFMHDAIKQWDKEK